MHRNLLTLKSDIKQNMENQKPSKCKYNKFADEKINLFHVTIWFPCYTSDCSTKHFVQFNKIPFLFSVSLSGVGYCFMEIVSALQKDDS